MHIEISALFPLHLDSSAVSEKSFIGDGVFIERLNREWVDEVKLQCPKVAAMEIVEPVGKYTHRFFYEIPIPNMRPLNFENALQIDIQLLLHAIILSKIVKPTSIGYASVFVKSYYSGRGTVRHLSNSVLNNNNISYVDPENESYNTLSKSDIKIMAELWDSFRFLFINPKYTRLRQAIIFNEWAYSFPFAEVSHPTSHSALEAMICVEKQPNKQQVVQRLPQLISSVTQEEAEEIYLLCCDLKHSASGLLKDSPDIYGIASVSDRKRKDAVTLLRQSIREILIKAFRDRNFADILADPQLLRDTYKIFDKNGHLIP